MPVTESNRLAGMLAHRGIFGDSLERIVEALLAAGPESVAVEAADALWTRARTEAKDNPARLYATLLERDGPSVVEAKAKGSREASPSGGSDYWQSVGRNTMAVSAESTRAHELFRAQVADQIRILRQDPNRTRALWRTLRPTYQRIRSLSSQIARLADVEDPASSEDAMHAIAVSIASENQKNQEKRR